MANLPSSDRTPQRWFDTTAFVAAPPFAFGNSGRGILDGPGTKLLDVSVLKRMIFREKHSLEIRADAFNALNTPQFAVPGLTLAAPDFGRISSTYPARNIQFGLHYAF